MLDDECKPNVAVQVATKMAADKEIIAAATHYCSSTAIATVDVYHKFGLPVVVWGAVLPDITYRNKYAEIHRVNGTMINQNDANAELVSKLGYKTFAVIHDTTDYGKGHNQYFSAALAKLGGKIVGTFGVTADQQDFTAELTQIKALNPEVIYFGGLTPIGVRIRSQMDKLGIKAVFDGTSGIVSDAFIQGLGPLAEGALAFREGAPTEKLPGGKFFMEKYTAQKYDNPPEAYGAFAYAAMDLILDSDREGRPGPQEGHRRDGEREGPRLHRRQDHVRRSRPEHRRGDHQIRHPGRQVRGVGRQRIRLRQAQAARPEVAGHDGPAGSGSQLAMPSHRQQLPAEVNIRWPRIGPARRWRSDFVGPISPCGSSMDAGLLAQYVMNGLMLGMMYALVAVGFTLFFGVLDVIKFSHGDVLTVGAFTALATFVGLGPPGISSSPLLLLVMLVVAIVAMAALGMLIAALSGAAAALGAGAQHAADHVDARHGAARSGAAVLSRRAPIRSRSRRCCRRVDQFRQFQPAARQRHHAGGRRSGHRRRSSCCSTAPSSASPFARWRRTRRPRAPWASTSPPSC